MDEIVETKPLYKVAIKYSKEKDERIMTFKSPVHIFYNILNSTIGIYDDVPGNCLFLTKWNLVDYCQVLTDEESQNEEDSNGKN